MFCYVKPILGMETIEIRGATWVGGNRTVTPRPGGTMDW